MDIKNSKSNSPINPENSDLPLNIKEEPQENIKDYAEHTMNELLGWYGYDKVNSKDTEHLNLERYTATSSLNEDEDGLSDDDVIPDDASFDDSIDSSSIKSADLSKGSLSRSNSESSLAAQHRNLVSALTKKHGLTGAPEGTIPSGYIVCAWCQKPGVKLFTLRTGNGTKAFCSELCFTQCRRASFKKNKICDWCKHVRHTVNYVDFQDGDSQLQFCSAKCLNQYKMNIFCRETQEHLQKIKGQVDTLASSDDNAEQEILITPDLWMKDGKKEKNKSRKTTCKDDDDEEEKPDINSRIPTIIKCEPKSENKLMCASPSSSQNGDKSNMASRAAMEHMVRERHRRHSSKESPRTHASTSSASDVSPQSMHSSLLSNGVHPMAQWIPPQFWGTFGPGMPPIGAYPPWFYPGFMPPLPGMMHPGLGMEPGLVRSSSVPVSTPGRSVMSPGSDSRSSSSTPNQNRQLTSRQPTPGINSEPKSPRQQSSPNPSFMPYPSVVVPPLMVGDQRVIGPGMSNQPHSGENVVPGAPPPLTMVMPVPIPLPVPIPIPLPLPITMEKILEVFDKQGDNSKKERKRDHSNDRIRHKLDVQNLRHKTEKDSKDSEFVAIHKSDINENETVPKDRVSCVSCHSERSTSVGSCPELTSSSPLSERRSSVFEYVSNKRSLTPQTDGSLDLSKKSRVERTPECDGAIDLSKDSITERYKNSPGKENRDSNDSDNSHSELVSDNGEEESSSKVPKIHIISPRMDPPLSQQMPLPPADPKYSSRRGLILDAPCVPNKRQRSPSPDRRSYVRAVPRDIMEAARRRCMRARIRTK